jgi:hypothetical protein
MFMPPARGFHNESVSRDESPHASPNREQGCINAALILRNVGLGKAAAGTIDNRRFRRRS